MTVDPTVVPYRGGHRAGVLAVAVSPDGVLIASAGETVSSNFSSSKHLK